jgi:TRAP transporter TAXI family solute receptor
MSLFANRYLTNRYAVPILSIIGSFLIVSLILAYLFPAPPSTVTMATAFKGGSFDYYGQRYKERFAKAGINLELRETDGALENLALLRDKNSGVQLAFVTGGVSKPDQTPGVLSFGTIDYLPIWIFYSASVSIDQLSDLKGKRIAIGPVGSGTRFTAERVLSDAGISAESADFSPLAGLAAAQALRNGEVDVAWIMGAPSTSAVQSLIRESRISLFNFSLAEAFTRLHSNLVKLVLPRGVIDISGIVPKSDVTLLATTSSVLVRNDLHPEIANLLLQTMREVHGSHGTFQHIGEFPLPTDPDYPVALSAVDYFKSGPSFLQRHLPLWLIVHVQRATAVLVAAVAIGLPLFHYLPILYTWYMRRRLLFWYSQLKTLEDSISSSGGAQSNEPRVEIDRIENAVSQMRVPLALANQLYDLRGHIEIVRRRFAATYRSSGEI